MLNRLNNLSLGSRLATMVGTLGVLATLLAVGGLIGMDDSASRLKSVYEDRVLAIENLTGIMNELQEVSIVMLETGAKTAAGEALNVAPIKKKVDDKIASTDQAWKAYMAGNRTAAEKAPAEDYVKARKAYFEDGLRPAIAALEKFNTVDFTAAYQRATTLFGPMHDSVERLERLQNTMVKADYEGAAATFQLTRMVMIAALLLGLVFSMTFAVVIVRSVTRRVGAMQQALTATARAHDLTQRVPVEGRDEVGRMAEAFNTLMQELQHTLQTVMAGAQEVSSASTEMASAASQITTTASAQAEAAASTAAAVEQVTVSINQVAESSREAKAVSDEASSLSATGESTARNTAAQMARTADSVAQSMKLIESLSQRSNEISGIVKVIRDIAEQTNLLALNAAIEAARAGEQGRGFAVVADEVRKLAERTSSSTSEISNMIEAIQGEVHNAVSNLKTNNDQVAEGRRLAEEVAATLSSINTGARTTMQRISDINAAVTEQSSASTDIARNVEKIAQMAEETNAAVGQAATAAGSLESLAAKLHADVSRFKA